MRVKPYYSADPSDGEVYHEDSDCLPGTQIRLRDVREGKGPADEYQRCPICNHMRREEKFNG